MVDNNSGLYEGSTISAVAVAIIPVIVWFMRYGTVFPPDWKVKTFCLALVFACLLIPVGTSTRTGLLCIVLLAVLQVRAVRKKARYIAMLALLGVVAVPFLPAQFTQRMDTIKSYQADASASTRIAVWGWTWEFAKSHPFGGGFEAYRGNHFRYELVKTEGSAASSSIQNTTEVDKARAFHSAYFEMLGEQGYPGLVLWLLISLTGIVRMEVLRRRYREGEFAWAGSLAGALQSAHLVYLLGAAFIAIAFQPFVYMLIGAQIGLDTYLARKRSRESFRSIGRHPMTAGSSMNRPAGELRALTGARGIAAWLVVFFHIRLSIAGTPAPLAHVFAKGYLAVDFFFLLSGFVIWLSWGERLHDNRWVAVGPFLRKRFARVWPLHAVMLAATVALALLLVATGRADPVDFPFPELPLNVLLLQNWGFTDRLAWNVPVLVDQRGTGGLSGPSRWSRSRSTGGG